jgi:hypothetical protein
MRSYQKPEKEGFVVKYSMHHRLLPGNYMPRVMFEAGGNKWGDLSASKKRKLW